MRARLKQPRAARGRRAPQRGHQRRHVHGPVGGKKDYARFRDFLKAVQAHVKANPKMSGKELDEAFDHKTWSDFKPLGKFLSYDKFFDIAAGRRPK